MLLLYKIRDIIQIILIDIELNC